MYMNKIMQEFRSCYIPNNPLMENINSHTTLSNRINNQYYITLVAGIFLNSIYKQLTIKYNKNQSYICKTLKKD